MMLSINHNKVTKAGKYVGIWLCVYRIEWGATYDWFISDGEGSLVMTLY